MSFEWVVEPMAIIAAFCAIVITGILSGLVPAVRAERLEVIEALRQE
jgi:ABC-type lipoprotein release transport system permease subunit